MRAFWQPLSTFNFRIKDWAIGCISTHIWHFSNIFSFPKILTLKSFGNSWGNPCTKFVMLDIKYRFTCGDSDQSEIIKKCQNIMTWIIWKFSFALYSSNDDSTFWEKYQFCRQNVSSFRKELIRKVEKFLKSNFDVNQRCKIVLKQNQ